MNFRTGLGTDLHRLVEGRPFIIGGVTIPAERGEDGHSDGDALAHAIADALLGAAAIADIGELFPPGDPAYKNASSMRLLEAVRDKIAAVGWKIVNIDAVVECETPKILPYRMQIRESLAKTLEIPVENVFVKGKTGEKLGDIGEGRAVYACAVCLLAGFHTGGQPAVV